MKIKQNCLIAGLVLTALTLLASADPAMAGDQVPFKGKETGVITSLSFQFPFDMKGQTAEGEATQIGHYTLTGEFAVDVRLGGGTGTFTMTAANGDMIFLDGEAHVVPTNLTKTVSTFTVTGGTGRFVGATGSFTAHNQLTFFVGASPNPYVAEIEGNLSTPGANKE
jgi:hypothetical protein